MFKGIKTTLFILTILTTISMQPHEDVINPQQSETSDVEIQDDHPTVEPNVQKEIQQRDSIPLNYEHVRNYAFLIHEPQNYMLQVDSDHKIRGVISSYTEKDKVYLETYYQPGEEIHLEIVVNNRGTVYQRTFYHTAGFEFDAKAGYYYSLRFSKNGNPKLIQLYMENWVQSGTTQNAMSQEHILNHQQKSKKIKDKLSVYLAISESNALLNEKMIDSVKDQTQSYLYYHIFQMVVLAVIVFGQYILIKRLLKNGMSIV